jgi:queuine tRNA-ribosyltransferase
MPVGTRGTVKTVDVADLAAVGAEMILANTYHLMLRPGAETVSALGEVHGFTGWKGPILTDSGGYQVFSLASRVTEDGVLFRSTYDGATVELTPERAVHVQEQLGSDIAMVLDHLVGLPAPRGEVEAAMERTLRWSRRALDAKQRCDRALFGIVQGGVDPELRARSAAGTAALGFAGFGIGGLSVGEPAADRDRAIEAVVPELPPDRVRYVMGLGDTEGILAAVGRGCDLFDCVLPTRLARHGKALTRNGDFGIKRSEWAREEKPIDPECGCFTCRTHSRGYLRHLHLSKEPLGRRLLTIHNLHYTLELMAGIRTAICAGSFDQFAAAARSRRSGATSPDAAE